VYVDIYVYLSVPLTKPVERKSVPRLGRIGPWLEWSRGGLIDLRMPFLLKYICDAVECVLCCESCCGRELCC
jgi:hypothetical protein